MFLLWVTIYIDMAAIPPPAAYSSDQPSNSSSGDQDNDTEEGMSIM